MKKILISCLTLLLLCVAVQAHALSAVVQACVSAGGAAGASCADTSCTGFLWCQNFEGTGYDNSESWSTSGTVDPDYTTAVLRGSQSCSLANGSTIYRNVTTDGEIYAFARYQFTDATPTAAAGIFKALNGASDVGWVSLLATGKLACFNGTASNGAASALSNDTTYYIWIRMKSATSAEATDGIVTAEVSTTRNRADINATLGCSVTTGDDDDTDITAIRYMNNAAGGAGIKIDQLLGSTTTIGDVCE